MGNPRDEEVEAGQPPESRMLDGSREAIGRDRGEEAKAGLSPLSKRRQGLAGVGAAVARLLGPSFRIDWGEACAAFERDADTRTEFLDFLIAQDAADFARHPFGNDSACAPVGGV